MLSARVELRGEEVFCADTGEGGVSTVRRLTQETLARLKGWAERYDAAVRSDALPPLIDRAGHRGVARRRRQLAPSDLGRINR